jgi:Arc-like DNA binding domain
MARKGKTRKTSTRFGSKVVSFNLRMPETLRRDLEEAAARNEHSMNAEIVWRLADHILMAKQQLAPPAIAYRKQFARVPSVTHKPPVLTSTSNADQKSELESELEKIVEAVVKKKMRETQDEITARMEQLRAEVESVRTGDKEPRATETSE